MFELSTHQTQNQKFSKEENFIRLYNPPYQVCKTFTMSATVTNAKIKLKNQLHKNYLVFNENEPSGKLGRSGWGMLGQCAGMLTLVVDL